MAISKTITDFNKAHPTRAAKEKALKGMTNGQIDKLIKATTNIKRRISILPSRRSEV